MKSINLYQDEFRPARVILPARHILLALLAFLLLLGAVAAWQGAGLAHLRAEAAAAKAQADALAAQAKAARKPEKPADPALVAEAEAWERRGQALRQAQEAITAGQLGSETGHAARFRALAQARADGAWLTRIEVAEAGREMTLQGRALTGADPARLIAALRRQPLFAGLNYAGLEVESPREEAGGGNRAAAKPAKEAPAAPRHLEFTLRARNESAAAPVPASTPPALPGGASAALTALSGMAAPAAGARP